MLGNLRKNYNVLCRPAQIYVLISLIAVLAIDWASVKIRDRYIMKAEHGRQLKTSG